MQFTEVFSLINQMQADGVIESYAVGGATAAAFYIEAVATVDIDVFVAFIPRPGALLVDPSAVFDYLCERGAEPEGEYLKLNGWLVQLLAPTGPLCEEALREAVEQTVEGVAVRLLKAEHLAALALETGRAKDKVRLRQFLDEGVLDASRFQSIIERHALTSKLQQFLRQD
jgi:hypothetical protein